MGRLPDLFCCEERLHHPTGPRCPQEPGWLSGSDLHWKCSFFCSQLMSSCCCASHGSSLRLPSFTHVSGQCACQFEQTPCAVLQPHAQSTCNGSMCFALRGALLALQWVACGQCLKGFVAFAGVKAVNMHMACSVYSEWALHGRCSAVDWDLLPGFCLAHTMRCLSAREFLQERGRRLPFCVNRVCCECDTPSNGGV